MPKLVYSLQQIADIRQKRAENAERDLAAATAERADLSQLLWEAGSYDEDKPLSERFCDVATETARTINRLITERDDARRWAKRWKRFACALWPCVRARTRNSDVQDARAFVASWDARAARKRRAQPTADPAPRGAQAPAAPEQPAGDVLPTEGGGGLEVG